MIGLHLDGGLGTRHGGLGSTRHPALGVGTSHHLIVDGDAKLNPEDGRHRVVLVHRIKVLEGVQRRGHTLHRLGWPCLPVERTLSGIAFLHGTFKL